MRKYTSYYQPEGTISYSEAPAVKVMFVCSVNEVFPKSHPALTACGMCKMSDARNVITDY